MKASTKGNTKRQGDMYKVDGNSTQNLIKIKKKTERTSTGANEVKTGKVEVQCKVNILWYLIITHPDLEGWKQD